MTIVYHDCCFFRPRLWDAGSFEAVTHLQWPKQRCGGGGCVVFGKWTSLSSLGMFYQVSTILWASMEGDWQVICGPQVVHCRLVLTLQHRLLIFYPYSIKQGQQALSIYLTLFSFVFIYLFCFTSGGSLGCLRMGWQVGGKDPPGFPGFLLGNHPASLFLWIPHSF